MRKTFCIRKRNCVKISVLILLAAIFLFSLSGCAVNGFAASDDRDGSNSTKNASLPSDQTGNGDAAEKQDTDNTDKDAILNGDPGIVGYVMAIEGGRMLVVSSEAEDFSSTGGVNEFYNAIWFSDAPDTIQIGEKAKVWFDIVEESYPAQSKALKTEKVPAEQWPGAVLTKAEAIQKALESDELSSAFLIVLKSIRYEEAKHEWVVELKDVMDSKDYQINVEESGESADEPDPLMANEDLQLGALKVNMTKDEVTKTMKAALLRSEKEDVSGIATEFLYYTDDTVIHLVEGKIYSIAAASADYVTPRGLKVGDTEEKLRKLYGEPDHVDVDGVWVYSAREYDLFFVTIVDHRVTSIQVSLVM